MERNLLTNFVTVAKERKLTLDSAIMVFSLCCSDQMHEAGYSSEQALEKAIELVKTKDKKEVYSELLKMTGYKED